MTIETLGDHSEWVRQIEAEVEGELSLAERAALARHLTNCPRCAGARASHLELRAAMAAAAGDPHAASIARAPLSKRSRFVLVLLIVLAAAAGGWFAHEKFGAPGRGSLEAGRATIVTP
jgi:anti-sigma factor RsiW